MGNRREVLEIASFEKIKSACSTYGIVWGPFARRSVCNCGGGEGEIPHNPINSDGGSLPTIIKPPCVFSCESSAGVGLSHMQGKLAPPSHSMRSPDTFFVLEMEPVKACSSPGCVLGFF